MPEERTELELLRGVVKDLQEQLNGYEYQEKEQLEKELHALEKQRDFFREKYMDSLEKIASAESRASEKREAYYHADKERIEAEKKLGQALDKIKALEEQNKILLKKIEEPLSDEEIARVVQQIMVTPVEVSKIDISTRADDKNN